MKLINFFVLLALIGFISCSNEILDSTNQESNTFITKATTNSDTIMLQESFLYKGHTHNATYYLIGDSVIKIIANENTLQILNHLDSISGSGTYIYGDGVKEYFDNESDMMKNLDKIMIRECGIELQNNISPYGFIPENPACTPDWNGNIGSLYLCDDDGYGGKVRHIFYPTNADSVAVTHLKPTYEMNDKTTAFCAYAQKGTYILLNLYEDDNFQGSFISKIIDGAKDQFMNQGIYSLNRTTIEGNRTIEFGGIFCPDLKKIVLRRDIGKTWNDRITSVKMKKTRKPIYP